MAIRLLDLALSITKFIGLIIRLGSHSSSRETPFILGTINSSFMKDAIHYVFTFQDSTLECIVIEG